MRYRITTLNGANSTVLSTAEIEANELAIAQKIAIPACKDFIRYHDQFPDEYKGFTLETLDAICNASSAIEVERIMKKARAVA